MWLHGLLTAAIRASLPTAPGNNLRLSSDTCRRVLLARIDAETETAKHGALLEAWHQAFGTTPTTVAKAGG
jgi:hypothetical protein